MKKRYVVGTIVASLLFIGAIGGAGNEAEQSTIENAAPGSITVLQKSAELPTCDGVTIISSCTVDSVQYSTYVYHEAVPEKSHTEEYVASYKDEISSYCTLCNDGTYSPSCATGRGACSRHGGVAQWNAPRYRKVPVYATRVVVDTPARAEYYEKVVQE